jgi:tRNA U38,U39,U40 pseudouridine synthase TruA
MAALLACRDRRRAGRTAPACGLTLEWVRYDDAALGDFPTEDRRVP